MAAAISMCITLINEIQFVPVMQMHVANALHLYLHVQYRLEIYCVGNGGGNFKPCACGTSMAKPTHMEFLIAMRICIGCITIVGNCRRNAHCFGDSNCNCNTIAMGLRERL